MKKSGGSLKLQEAMVLVLLECKHAGGKATRHDRPRKRYRREKALHAR